MVELDEIVTGTPVPADGYPVVEVDPSGRPVAWKHLPGVEGTPALVTVPLAGTVDAMLPGHASLVAVVDDEGRMVGALHWDSLVGELRVQRRPQ